MHCTPHRPILARNDTHHVVTHSHHLKFDNFILKTMTDDYDVMSTSNSLTIQLTFHVRHYLCFCIRVSNSAQHSEEDAQTRDVLFQLIVGVQLCRTERIAG